jgi:hypothetical protein
VKRGDIVPGGEHGRVVGPQVRGDGQLKPRVVHNIGMQSRILIMHLEKKYSMSDLKILVLI